MKADRSTIFREVADAFDIYPVAIDVQSDTMDILEITLSALGEKDAFVGIASDKARALPYQAATQVAERYGAFIGSGQVVVHRPCRPLRIEHPGIAAGMELRSRKPAPVFWSTRDPRLHELLLAGDTTSLTDVELLGYPDCCVTWHYDCYFARGAEAFADVALRQGAVDAAMTVLDSGWFPSSGWFLPSEYYLGAILASNSVYPFIDHIACPACLKISASKSAQTNMDNSKAVFQCDPVRHSRVQQYSKHLDKRIRSLLQDRTRLVESKVEELSLDVRGKDAYSRHSRHLFKALGLEAYR